MADQAVLFDCDGVLVDSEPITNRLLRDDLARHGLDMPLNDVMSLFVGGTMEDVAQQARDHGAALPATWVEDFYQIMFAGLAETVEAVPFVSDLLDRLSDMGVACAVASNGPLAKMDITLRRTGLFERLSPHIYSARDLERPKPAPDVYLHAAAQLGVSPQHCIVIEDSVSGARAGRAAEMRCIGFAARGQGGQLVLHCDVVIHDMREVIQHLRL